MDALDPKSALGLGFLDWLWNIRAKIGAGKMKIVVDPEKCRATGDCVTACPEDAISVVDGVASIDESKCDLDGICIPACPHGAISFSEEE